MDRRTKQTFFFFQREYAGDQQAHENMLDITNHQENANQNHNEISLLACQHGCHQKEYK